MTRQLEVTGIIPRSLAADAGVKAGDILLKANGKSLKSQWDMSNAISNASDKDGTLNLTVLRDGDVFSIPIPCQGPDTGMEYEEYDVNKKPTSDSSNGKKKGLAALTTPLVIALLGYTALYYFYNQRMISNAEGLLHDNNFPNAEVVRASFPLIAPLATKADIDIVVEQQGEIDAVVMTIYGNPFYSNDIYMEISGEDAMKLRL